MSDQAHTDANDSSQYHHGISDLVSVIKMHSLTRLGRLILPRGLWHGKHGHGDNEDIAAMPEDPGSLYLTFDDGPNPKSTPYLLELLEGENVTATFFLIGRQVERHPSLVKRIADAGHVVGNHSYAHLFIPALSVTKIETEIHLANHRIEEITGKSPTLFRPPFGIIDQRAADCLKERGMTPVYWGAVPEDWEKIGSRRVVQRVFRQLSPGSLIVLHELDWNASQTLKATREIIKRLKGKGYCFKSIKCGASPA